MRVCVCTSYPADREPRGPRHARAIWETGFCASLTFIDLRPANQPRVEVDFLRGIPELNWISLINPLRSSQRMKWGLAKLQKFSARGGYKYFGIVSNAALSPALTTLQRVLESQRPDVIVAHNIDTLLPAYRAAKSTGASLIFDSMEFHSDMGDDQDSITMNIIKSIESRCLPACAMVLTSSIQVANALKTTYGIDKLLPLDNVPKVHHSPDTQKQEWLSLYWRNSTIGLGQRGLEEAIRALQWVPKHVTLHLQGRHTPDGLAEVRSLAESIGVLDRVSIHPPYRSEDAVKEASRFHIGLCLERNGIRNHELTVSNKMFDYHMAGLAVISSDMPSLTDVLRRSEGGLTYRAGDASDLARAICELAEDRTRYVQLSSNARRFAVEQGNLDVEMAKLKRAFQDSISSRISGNYA